MLINGVYGLQLMVDTIYGNVCYIKMEKEVWMRMVGGRGVSGEEVK